MRSISQYLIWLALPALAVTAPGALAEVSRHEEAIRYRQAVMTMTKRHYEKLSALAKGKVPYVREEAERNAVYLDMLARVSPDGFVAGSDAGDTRAKPDIWKDWARFRGLMEKYQAETGRLLVAARSGQVGDLKSAVDDLTRVCKTCHDDFKKSAAGN